MIMTGSDGRQGDGDEDEDENEVTESDGGEANNGGKVLPMSS